ncbi:N-acetyltransferase B complex non catalytic subunit-domain-containing protein [Phycomyces nitens]|nr:N-acetyltransferase B complex non catalytic subunit-domain-containing protein [Phycomyces nitens]
MALDYATEKKLRPLYEAIDDCQYKQALQLVNKMLKKTPDWPLIKASWRTYVQSTKYNVTRGKTDNGLLDNAIVELYESAANSQPKNEEFANHWFMAMVRSSDYKGQQQAALKLHRTFKHNKYLFWGIMSLALQGAGGSSLSYMLSERMMAKAQEEGRLEEVEHFRLYLLILLDQKKHEEALALFDTPLGKKSLRDPEVRQMKTELLLTNKKWSEVLVASEQALVHENSDDWINWLAYFDAVEALVAEDDKETINNAHQLIEKLKKSALEAPMMKRGPFLAELEFEYRLSKKQAQGQDQPNSLQNVVAYFSRFGSKSCCFEDLQNYTCYLRSSPEKAKEFVDSLRNTIKETDEKSGKVKNIYKDTNIRKLERFLGLQSQLSLKEGIELVNGLWKAYEDALPLGNGLEKTEYQYGDEYVILASHILLDLYNEHKNTSLLIQAVSILETALLKSVSNFQIKLALQIYATMEIKQIQFDTMIFFSLGCLDEVEQSLYEGLSIYKSNEVETPEMLVKAYQYGTFSKIQEFIEFRNRLDTSLQHSISMIELIRIDAMNATFQIKSGTQFFHELDVSKIKCDDAFIDGRSDNRDFKVFMNCNSKETQSAQEVFKPTISTNKTWVQMFSFIFNILSAACDTKGVKDLGSVVEQFTGFLDRENVQTNVTLQEYWLAKYVCKLSNALVLSKSPVKNAETLLKDATEIMETHVIETRPYKTETISWVDFHQTTTVLEVFNYGSILLEMLNRGLGLTSKDAKRKAAENKVDEVFVNLTALQAATKKSMVTVQTNVKTGKDIFRIQLQKKIIKDITSSETAIDYFKTKEAQTILNDHLKTMVTSWALSIERFSEEVNKRILKM